MGIEIAIKCVRCDTELDVVPPLLFKDPILEISVFRCKCKDAEQAVEADGQEPCAYCKKWKEDIDRRFCYVCGRKLPAA